jgi:hypothetical protein
MEKRKEEYIKFIIKWYINFNPNDLNYKLIDNTYIEITIIKHI